MVPICTFPLGWARISLLIYPQHFFKVRKSKKEVQCYWNWFSWEGAGGGKILRTSYWCLYPHSNITRGNRTQKIFPEGNTCPIRNAITRKLKSQNSLFSITKEEILGWNWNFPKSQKVGKNMSTPSPRVINVAFDQMNFSISGNITELE